MAKKEKLSDKIFVGIAIILSVLAVLSIILLTLRYLGIL